MKITTNVARYAILASLMAVVGGMARGESNASDPTVVDIAIFRPNTRILFQGDSITDMNRGRSDDPNHILGHSYAFIIGGIYGEAFPERQLTFINRGVSGNKVSDLAGRWKADTIDQKPDLLSILIGVNDLGAHVPVDQFEQQYDKLLSDTRMALPKARLVLCEPFGLPSGSKKEAWADYHADLLKRQEVVRHLAEKYRATFVPLQKAFDDACKRAPADYWIWDGVHPTYSGQRVLAKAWIKAAAGIPASTP